MKKPSQARRTIPLFFLAALFSAAPLSSKTYYINRGVWYHIGDNRFSLSEDAEFMGTYPAVGREWVQAFRVDQDDQIKVRIGRTRGVDDCAYCKAMVYVSDWPMLRLSPDNNKIQSETLEPLARKVEAGRTYYLRIVSESHDDEADDFSIADVSVESERANITFLQPGPVLKAPEEPMPQFSPPKQVAGPCGSLEAKRNWPYGFESGVPVPVSLSAGTRDFQQTLPLETLSPGSYLDIDLRLDLVESGGEWVDQAVELLYGEEEGSRSGWVYSFLPGSKKLIKGNTMREGHYSRRVFDTSAFMTHSANRLRISYCRDGRVSLSVNGSLVSQGFMSKKEALPVLVRALGAGVTLVGR